MNRTVQINNQKRGFPLSDENRTSQVRLIELTADIVSAYISKNSVPAGSLPDLIESINASLSKIRQPTEPETPTQEPAVNPKRSVFPDYIVCLEDGKKFKSLKRHLNVHYGLMPDEYREKWGLKADYPMVAPNYAAQRSALAKSSGLGRKTAVKPTKKAVRQPGRRA
ncbi:MucR family transcriptional regulator [Mesorhizobium sp. 131-3-5]|uniref:MucR family transcriptional regulator n=1 Tax=Mesorhizobium sp. 131-3-5 TaxID=2744520 RepID=UPI0019257467|nr:MucR family transcriptional regulator [Mesorhizobium sp. 131-3-5]